MTKNDRINAVIDAALRDYRRRNNDRRHPATVTSDRLRLDYERFYEHFSGSELVAIGTVRNALQRIAEADEMRCVNCNVHLDWTDPEMGTCPRCGDEWSPDHFKPRTCERRDT
jgi:hypothetical protein